MMTRFHRYLTPIGLVALLALGVGCNFTTANLSSFKVGKDAKITSEADTFAPGETIYALAYVANVPSKVTVKIETIYDELTDGKPNYHIEAFDKSYDVDKSATITYNLSPPPKGWPAGKYHLKAALHVESGEQKDEKIVRFTVKTP